MRTKLIFLMILCMVVMLSCNEKRGMEKAVGISSDMLAVASHPPPPPPSMNQEPYSPKLVKKGALSISSRNIESTKTVLYGFVKACNGYVTNENLVRDEFFNYYEISFNIEASLFDRFLQMLDSSGMNIVSRTFSVEDVTLKYADDSTRLQNKKKLEQKYLELLSKTNDMKNILEIEDKLEEIRTEIESKEGQMKMLEKQLAYSEFTVKIERDIVNLSYDDRTKFTYKIKQGIIRGWEGIKTVFVALVSLWPLFLLIAVIFSGIKTMVRRRRKQQ